MNNKQKYWSSRLNIILFMIMMVLTATLITLFAILLADATKQAASGASTFEPDRDLLTVFIVVIAVFVPYTVIYIVSVIYFFIKRERATRGTSIKIQLSKNKEIKSDEAKRMDKRFGAEIVDDSFETKGNLRYTYVLDEHEVNKPIIWKFTFYLLQENFILMLLLLLAGYGISIVLLFTSPILFWIIVSFLTLVLIFLLVFNLYIVPNNQYKRTLKNTYPTSVRAYEDRVDEVQVMPSGESIIYSCRYEYSKFKESGHYLFIKTRNEKVTTALLLDKDKLGEEMSNYIISNIKKK